MLEITSLLAIDPGEHTGLAFFSKYQDGWVLSSAVVQSPDVKTELLIEKVDIVVIENPQIYPRSRARPNDILKLARVVGRFEERFSRRGLSIIQLVTPHQWKGSVNGDIMLARIEAAMTPREKVVLGMYKGGYRHNAIDAIGLGKWAIQQPFMKQPRKRAA